MLRHILIVLFVATLLGCGSSPKTHFYMLNAEKTRDYVIAVSHGIVELDEFLGRDIDDIIKIADGVMYVEKRKFKASLKGKKDKG